MGRTACTEPQCLYKDALCTIYNSTFSYMGVGILPSKPILLTRNFHLLH
jgi:hypothetical protein